MLRTRIVEDPEKGKGRDRLYGVEENPEAVDEIIRAIPARITPTFAGVEPQRIPCLLRDGTEGHIVTVRVLKGPEIYSIVGDGTFRRLDKSNDELTAAQIVELSYSRGKISAETETVDVAFELLETPWWQTYCEARRIQTGTITERLMRLGLAKSTSEGPKPTRAAVLLFAEEPSGCLAAKASIRIFRYRGKVIERGPVPNLLKTPKTIGGPLIRQIADAAEYISQELGKGLVLTQSGFETIHGYPRRVLREAITNAVLHRDYRIARDIQVRIFDDRIEIESPGVFPGDITPANIHVKPSLSRNPLIVSHIRELPDPPNIDAGEGVRMMFQTMRGVGLYPPIYLAVPIGEPSGVLVVLLNEKMPSVWEQVSHWLDKKGNITNRQLRQIAGWDTLKASKVLRGWVAKGLLIPDQSRGKTKTVYRRAQDELPSLYPELGDKGSKGRHN